MRIRVEQIAKGQEEEIILRCYEVSDDLQRLVHQIENLQSGLTAYRNGEIHRLSFDEVYYFEVVDGKSFLYCKDCVFESKLRLNEFEKLSAETKFLRTSKSMVLNGDKIDFIKPSLSGRFEVTLLNGEKVIVSRQYVNALKKKMGL